MVSHFWSLKFLTCLNFKLDPSQSPVISCDSPKTKAYMSSGASSSDDEAPQHSSASWREAVSDVEEAAPGQCGDVGPMAWGNVAV